MTSYKAESSEAVIESTIDEMNPGIPERDGTDVSAGNDIFVAHKWSRNDTPAKRIRIPRNNINVTKLGNVFTVSGENEELVADEVHHDDTERVKKKMSNIFFHGQRQRRGCARVVQPSRS